MGKLFVISLEEENAFIKNHPELKGLLPQFLFIHLTCRAAGIAENLEDIFLHMFGDIAQGISPCSYCVKSLDRKKTVLESFMHQPYVACGEDDMC